MRIPAPLIAGLFVLGVLAAPAAQQQAPPAPPPGQAPAATPAETPQEPAREEPARADQPPIRTGINYVTVDVIVTDNKGKPVLDLKPEDFTVAEDGKPQKVESFSLITIKESDQIDAGPPREIRSTSDEEIEAKRPDVRLFILLLDDYHVRRGNDMAVRKPLIDFVENQLAPQDMVALMYPLTPVTGLQFSRNRRELVSAIEHFLGRKFDYTPRNEFEEQYAYYPASIVEKVRNDVVMGALRGAAVKLGGMREGRKSIIFVSEGFTSTLPPQLNDPIAAMPRLGNPARNNPNAQGPGDTVEFFNSAELLSDMREVFSTANRQNTSIYAVDPRGLAGFEYDINEGVSMTTDRKQLTATTDTLRVLAENTDGRAIVNRNDLAAGMRQIVRDQSGYYLLGYNSSEAPTDGRFHEIKVRVNRKGVEVRARKGYWAYTAEDAKRASAPEDAGPPSEVRDALNSIVEPVRGRPARFWIGTARGEAGKGRVTFAWEPIAGAENGARGEENAPARVLLTVTAPDGRPLFRGRVPEESAGGPGASTSFAAPPGQIEMRMVVENEHGQVIDSATQEMTVPDFTAVQVSMSTPQVFRARTVREAQAYKSEGAATPTADRFFSRTERVIIKVSAYAPGGETPALSARLLNRGGDAMADVPLQASGADGVVDLPLSALAAGDYLVELNAKTSSGTAQELVAFKVIR